MQRNCKSLYLIQPTALDHEKLPLFSQSVTVEKDTPLDVDAGFLTVTDSNPIDEDSYKCALSPSNIRDGSERSP